MEIFWTEHAKIKMRQYRLTESRVKRVLRFPKRREVGVAPRTVAAMQPAGSPKHPYEIWVMWEIKDNKDKIKNRDVIARRRVPLERDATTKQSRGSATARDIGGGAAQKQFSIISAWKYPGVSPIHEPPPIPAEDLRFW